MKILIPILFFVSYSSVAQVPIKKLLSFGGCKYDSLANYLIEKGWEYRGLDTLDGLHGKWSYKFDKTTKTATYWFYGFYKKFPKLNQDSITRIEMLNIGQAQYLDYIKQLPNEGFKKTKTLDWKGQLTMVFENQAMIDGKMRQAKFVTMVQYVPGIAGSNITRYQISVSSFH